MYITAMNFDYTKARKMIDKQGRKQKWLADQCLMNPAYLSQVLLGNQQPSLKIIYLMALALGCTKDDLLTSDRPKSRKAQRIA